MKLRINGFDNEIDFKNNINILVIEDKKTFVRTISLINNKVLGSEEKELLLLSDLKELKMSEKVYLLFDLYNIEYNVKKILNKIYSILDKNLRQTEDMELHRKLFELRNIIISEVNELPFEFTISDEVDYKDLLKIFDLKIDAFSYETVFEKIILLVDLIKTLNLAEVLIIPNLKIYLTNEELLELYKYLMYNNLNLLIIENNPTERLEYEVIYHIDKNFDEFIYN